MNNSTFALNWQQTECAVLVLRIQGHLDGATYTQLIEEAQSLYKQSHRHLILDLTHLQKVSLAGLFGLHSVAAIFNGEEPLAPEAGWQALRAMKHDLESGPQPKLKLSSPQPQVRNLLNQTGFDAFIDVYDDVGTAVAAFTNGSKAPTPVMA